MHNSVFFATNDVGMLTYYILQQMVNGELVYMPFYIAVPFINGMCHVLSRMTLPREDYHVLWQLAEGALLFQRNSNDIGGALSLTPWLKDVMPDYSGYNNLVKGNQSMLDFFKVCLLEFCTIPTLCRYLYLSLMICRATKYEIISELHICISPIFHF